MPNQRRTSAPAGIVDGKTAYSNPDGLTAAGAADSCEALKQQNKEIKSGNYWVKLKQFGTSQIVTKMVYVYM